MPITPFELFREFTAMTDAARAAEDYASKQVFEIAVDLVDGMLKGKTTDQWGAIYSHLAKWAVEQWLTETDDDRVQAWDQVKTVMEIAEQTTRF